METARLLLVGLRDEIDPEDAEERPSRTGRELPGLVGHWRQGPGPVMKATDHCSCYRVERGRCLRVASRVAECLQRYDGGQDQAREE